MRLLIAAFTLLLLTATAEFEDEAENCEAPSMLQLLPSMSEQHAGAAEQRDPTLRNEIRTDLSRSRMSALEANVEEAVHGISTGTQVATAKGAALLATARENLRGMRLMFGVTDSGALLNLCLVAGLVVLLLIAGVLVFYQRRVRDTEDVDVAPGSAIAIHMDQANTKRRSEAFAVEMRGRASRASKARRGTVSMSLALLRPPDDAQAKTSMMETAINSAKVMVGFSILALPYAAGKAGLMSAVVLVGLSFVCYGTAIMIGRLMTATKYLVLAAGLDDESHDWPFLAFVAFGPGCRVWCALVWAFELWTTELLVLVLTGMNLQLLMHDLLSRSSCIAISGVVSFFLIFPSPKTIAKFSMFGMVAIIMSVLALMCSGLFMKKWAVQVEPWHAMHWEEIPLAIGIFQSCFGAHAVFPCIYRDMANPVEEFEPAMKLAFLFAGCFNVSICLLAYAMYMDNAQESFMENLGNEFDMKPIPGMAFLYVLAASCFAIALQTVSPFITNGLIAAGEDLFGINQESKSAMRLTWKVVFMLVTLTVAIVMQDCMLPIQGIVGGFCGTHTVLIFPALFTIKLIEVSTRETVLIYLIMAYAAWALYATTYDSVHRIGTTMKWPF